MRTISTGRGLTLCKQSNCYAEPEIHEPRCPAKDTAIHT